MVVSPLQVKPFRFACTVATLWTLLKYSHVKFNNGGMHQSERYTYAYICTV